MIVYHAGDPYTLVQNTQITPQAIWGVPQNFQSGAITCNQQKVDIKFK